MGQLRVISGDQVRSLIDRTELRRALEAALVSQVRGQVSVPPRIAAEAPDGLMAAMPGFLHSGDGGVLATKVVTVFPGNSDSSGESSLPSHQGIIIYADPANGQPLALIDAEVITEERTAACAAIAADYLARADASVLTIVGAGAQGRAHLEAFVPIRPWRQIRIVSRNQPAAAVLAADARFNLSAESDVEIMTGDESGFSGFRGASRGADVIALCTHAGGPVIEASWVDSGCHVSSVGSLAELPLDLLSSGPIVVDQIGAVTSPPPAGAHELQMLDPDIVAELGSVIAGDAVGRTGDDEITIYKSTGHAVQDLAAAHLIYRRAIAERVGSDIQF